MPDHSARDDAFDRGNSHLALGELPEAEIAYREAVAFDDDFFDGWQALGMTLLKLEKNQIRRRETVLSVSSLVSSVEQHFNANPIAQLVMVLLLR